MIMTTKDTFFSGTRKLFAYYKGLGEKAIDQLDDEQISWRPDEGSNSIALLVHHLSGNMLSRFTDFLTADGEKPWRDREAEFDTGYPDKLAMMESWEKGWSAVFDAMDGLKEDQDEEAIVYIRNEGHSVRDALLRQLAHYASHVGQIIYIAKMMKGDSWVSLSIPKGGSKRFNERKFSQEKDIRHFTDKA
jgi:uncharacterized damage-inducible protein DinB